MAENAKIIKLVDGTEAMFDITTSLSDIDKRLSAEGLPARDTKIKPFAERGDVETGLAKINLPIVQGVTGVLGLPALIQEGLQLGAEKISQAGLNPLAAFYGSLEKKELQSKLEQADQLVHCPHQYKCKRLLVNISLCRGLRAFLVN